MLLSGVLDHCAQLKVLALITGSIRHSKRRFRRLAEEIFMPFACSDPRVVALLVEVLDDWQVGGLRRPDMWFVAEGVVARRVEGLQSIH